MALKNYQYQAIMRKYDEIQLRNRRLLSQRKEEVYQEIPELADLDKRIAESSVEQARKLIEGDGNALKELKKTLAELSREKQRLLEEYHFPADYLQPIYSCKDCKDTGYTDNREKCHCFVQSSIDLLYSQSNIRDILEQENFNTFRLDYYSSKPDIKTGCSPLDSASKAVETAKYFIRNFSYEYQNLLLCGNTGIGKTFLTNCIAKEILEKSYSVLYFSASQLFNKLGEITFSRTDTSNNSINEDIIECDLLIIDDLGTELTNAFVASSLFSCLNERHLRKKATIISTNLSLNELRDKYSERISSRISLNYQIIKLFGDDIRIKKRLT